MFAGFKPELFKFFDQLNKNNNREWFAKNKSRYEEVVLFPAMEFVRSLEKPLRKFSPHFTAVSKRSGGSIMRIYRDTRFSKDKTPYKTNLGIHFRHEAGKDVHAPGYYFHIDNKDVFVGAGIWHPDNSTLNKIRALIDDDPKRWKRVTNNKRFRERFRQVGNTLKRPPKGYEEAHPLIVDLKRKDHIGITNLSRKDLYSEALVEILIGNFKLAKPYVGFLCDALHLPS